MDIAAITHPHYDDYIQDWIKWRFAYLGGRRFINTYLKKFSAQEDDADFLTRKEITYCPRFAGAAVDEVKNSIFQRMVDISRVGGTSSYQEGINGGQFGVDLLGSSMNSFIGRKVLPELLVMRKVGVYIDMPIVDKLTLADNINVKPYIYLYTSEDIRSWSYDDAPNPNEYSSLLLREQQFNFDQVTRLPTESYTIYKHFWLEDGVVYVNQYSDQSDLLTPEPIRINIPRIPFVTFEISHSLMSETADYQVALLNMGSSDISYSLKSNYPFYTEQFDPRINSPYLKDNADEQNVQVGSASGRRYPVGTHPPAFIHPSSEPLLASMKKQEQLKQEIRLLINLAITNLQPSLSSAESKGHDERSLESGLSYIGLELEHGEQQIGQIWAMYEGSKDYPTISYPETYNLKSDEDRRKDVQILEKLLGAIPSKIYQKEIAKIIADEMLSHRVSRQTMKAIYNEITKAEVINIPPDVIVRDLEHGLVGLETASKARGYPDDEVAKAKLDHAERLKRIAISQQPGGGEAANDASRGIVDKSANPEIDTKAEKAASRDTLTDPIPMKKTRGQGQ